MKESLRLRLDQMVDRYEEVTALLSDPGVISDNNKFRELSVEHSDLMDITTLWLNYGHAEADQADAEVMLADASDPEMKEMMHDEIDNARDTIVQMEEALNVMMLPKDPNDKVPAFWRFVRVQVVMKRRFSQVICFECTKSMHRLKGGQWKYYQPVKVSMAVIKRLLPVYRVTASMVV